METIQVKITEKEVAALALLKSCGGDVLEVAQVACDAMRAGRGRAQRARRCIEAGAEVLRRLERTVSFEKAVIAALEARRERRARTQSDFRYFTRRFMKRCEGLASRRVRAITPQECTAYIETAFDTPRQRQKARLVLSGVFSTAVRRGWCSENPVLQVEVPRVVERRIEVLSPREIECLLGAARQYGDGCCLAAVGMMLYAGIRPHEVARLSWEQVNLKNRCISILPQHSKTGGARLVSIHAPLLRLLEGCAGVGRICPPQWLRHWRELRRLGGFSHWVPDVLRHTFASYHLRFFRNYNELQYETGHRDSTLLRTRYVSMSRLGDVAAFWA